MSWLNPFKKNIYTPEPLPPIFLPPFEFALAYTFDNEGGFSNDSYDKGGVTKYGIILDDLFRVGRKNATAKDIENLTREEAKAIYKKLYWDAMNLDSVKNKGVACALFDIGVVRGTGVPPKYVEEICGPGKTANDISPEVFIQKFSDRSESGFRQIVARNPRQVKFLNGWVNRAKRLLLLKSVQ
jgi:hypothetical protein